jgi:hypothetical protein
MKDEGGQQAAGVLRVPPTGNSRGRRTTTTTKDEENYGRSQPRRLKRAIKEQRVDGQHEGSEARQTGDVTQNSAYARTS